MPLSVFAIVMAGAILHATWNAIIKMGSDKLLTTFLVAVAAAVLSCLIVLLLPQPAAASWPFAGASAVCQVVYFLLVARAYRVADMSQTYPIMRGAAPLLVAIISAFHPGESLTLRGWLGLAAICAGIFSIAIGSKAHDRRGIELALINAGVIATYTMIDGLGVRRSGAPAAYTLWVFILTGVPLGLWALARMRGSFLSYTRRHWRIGIVGGIGTTASYGTALWAMTLAPVPVVAALRETSILFGTLIAAVILKEHVGPARVASAIMIALGAAILRLPPV